MHAEHGVKLGRVGRPGGQRRRHAIAPQPGIAGEEVELVPDLQGKKAARMVGAQPQQRLRGIVPAPIDEMIDGGEMALLPRRDDVRRRRVMRIERRRNAGGFGAKPGLATVAASAAASGSPL